MSVVSYDTTQITLKSVNHTEKAYIGLSDAYTFFNDKLFANSLPTCLITMQRKKNARGYFSPERFEAIGTISTDEIALNPASFNGRTLKEVLSTLVHEQVHLWQKHYGKPGRGNYHNAQWADKMKSIGLQPSDTGLPDGKETGQGMTHYIIQDGLFCKAADEFLSMGKLVLYSDKQTAKRTALAKKKADSKTKYVCLECELNVWAKPNANIRCGDCDCSMEPAL